MSWGQLKVGRINLRENYTVSDQVNAGTGEGTIALTGTESYPQPLTRAAWEALRADMMGIRGELVAVTFSNKSQYTGYYTVKDVGLRVRDWYSPDQAGGFDWSMTLTAIGPENAVDLESRLTGVVRANSFALTGERWQAPPPAHYAYWTGPTAPTGSVNRTMWDGTVIKVYRGLPAGRDPRWGCTAANYLGGRVQIKSANLERYGENILVPPTSWELSNGLVRVTPGSGSSLLEVAAADSAAWVSKQWQLLINAVAVPASGLLGLTVLRNDPWQVSMRLLASTALGRVLVDVVLRRGSRFIEGYVQAPSATTIKVQLAVAESATSTSGYVVKTTNDADGNRAIIGSALTSTADTAQLGISKAATLALDFWAGVVLDGGTAVSGDAAADLQNQYVGALAEDTMGVLR